LRVSAINRRLAARAAIEYVWGGSGRQDDETSDKFWY